MYNADPDYTLGGELITDTAAHTGRFKSIFSPYGDKKIGEFFEPITLRPASKIGMNYKLPKIDN